MAMKELNCVDTLDPRLRRGGTGIHNFSLGETPLELPEAGQ